MNLHLLQHTDQVEINWEQFIIIDEVEVLLTQMYFEWGGNEEKESCYFQLMVIT